MPYPTKKLWEISDFQWGSQPPKKEFIFEYKEWYIRFLQIRDFSNDKNITYIPKWNKNKLCVEDDILIWRYWASVWKILIWIAGAYNVALMKTFPDLSLIEKRFFYYYLKSDIFQIPLLKVSARAAQAWFSKKDIEDFLIPLPPLPTQKLIVQKLDSAFKNIDESIKITKKNIENIEELNKSVLEWIYNWSDFQQIELWNKKYLEIIDWDRWKNYPKKSEFTEKWYCLFLNTSNVRKWFFKFDKLDFITEEKYNLLWKWKAFINDIILTTRWTIWNTALIENNFPYQFIRINSWMVVLRVNLDLFFPKYLIHFINSSNFDNQKNNLVSWSAQPQLPIWVMKQIKIPLPPLSKQKEIVAYLDEVFEKNKKIKEWYEKKLKDLEEMKQSILKEAFENEEFVK